MDSDATTVSYNILEFKFNETCMYKQSIPLCQHADWLFTKSMLLILYILWEYGSRQGTPYNAVLEFASKAQRIYKVL